MNEIELSNYKMLHKYKTLGVFSVNKTYVETDICLCVLVVQSCLTLATPWTVTHQTPLSMGLARQEYFNELSFPSPKDLPNPGIEPMALILQQDILPMSHQGSSFCMLVHFK